MNSAASSPCANDPSRREPPHLRGQRGRPFEPKSEALAGSFVERFGNRRLSWNVLLAFLRLTTRAGLFRNPLPVDTAFDLVSSWLDQSSATIVHPGPNHLRIFRDSILPLGTGGNLTSDAHLAALAIEYGAELCSSDADFARFPGLKWRNPLR
jgi:toxin-antitoxin system PIN domain toxin